MVYYSALEDQYSTHKSDYESMYQDAKELLNNSKYEEAAKAFNKLGAYSDSIDMEKEAYYLEAKELIASEKGIDAVEILTMLGDYKDCKELVDKIGMTLSGMTFEPE